MTSVYSEEKPASRQLPTVERSQDESRTLLTNGWRLRAVDTSGPLTDKQLKELSASAPMEHWFAVERMPMQVHDVLASHGQIEDVAMPGNSEVANWVAKSDWVYRYDFPKALGNGLHDIQFDGLDTVVDVYLNQQHIAKHANCYLPLRQRLGSGLQEGDCLLLHFHSHYRYWGEGPERGVVDGVYSGPPDFVRRCHHLRKPNSDFRFFLGAPPDGLAKIGVFDDVFLEPVGNTRILHLDTEIELTRPYKNGIVKFSVEGENASLGNVVEVVLTDPDGKVVSVTKHVLELYAEQFVARGAVQVESPSLWWPRGYGAQSLYKLTANVLHRKSIVDVVTKTIGFREVRMPDLFQFWINGKRVRLYGFNIAAPLDARTYCWDQDRFSTLMMWAENANCNALRLWGGSSPFPAQVFDEADERGILLWHDFYHQGGGYPDGKEFREQCVAEAAQLLRSRKHHPSILLWCGGNENHQTAEMYNNGFFTGREIFEVDYANLCKKLDPATPYIPNCPYAESWANNPKEGDVHDWSSHFFIPGIRYPVFYSELCHASGSQLKTIKRVITDPEDLWPTGFVHSFTSVDDFGVPPAWRHFMQPPNFDQRYYSDAIHEFPSPDTPEKLVYALGAADEIYTRESVERFRRGRPSTDQTGRRRCEGVLQWKLNDCFPQMFSGAIDYFLEPTMKYYAHRRAFEPVLVSINVDDSIEVWVINDSNSTIRGNLVVRQFDPAENQFVRELREPVACAEGESRQILDLDVWRMLPRSHLIVANLEDESGKTIHRAIRALNFERRLRFPDASIEVSEADGVLTLQADSYARCVELVGDSGGDKFGWYFDDNFFDLLPNEKKEIRILSRPGEGTVTAKAVYSSTASTVRVQ